MVFFVLCCFYECTALKHWRREFLPDNNLSKCYEKYSRCTSLCTSLQSDTTLKDDASVEPWLRLQ